MIPLIHFSCPGCSSSIDTPLDCAGRLIECPDCGAEITVPSQRPTPLPPVRTPADHRYEPPPDVRVVMYVAEDEPQQQTNQPNQPVRLRPVNPARAGHSVNEQYQVYVDGRTNSLMVLARSAGEASRRAADLGYVVLRVDPPIGLLFSGHIVTRTPGGWAPVQVEVYQLSGGLWKVLRPGVPATQYCQILDGPFDPALLPAILDAGPIIRPEPRPPSSHPPSNDWRVDYLLGAAVRMTQGLGPGALSSH